MRFLIINLIKLYQKTLSPDHGWFKARYPYGFCRFYPTCSQYAIEALSKHGMIKGVYLAVKRIIRCNPFTTPSVDNV
jgi:uncharacterized protein